MTETFVLAHLSDIHLGPLPWFWPRHWNVKRMLGYANWQRRRRFVHRPDIVARLVADLRAQPVDHIAVTGDLTNTGMPSEHELAQAWLEDLGPPSDVSTIPGNHDIYTHLRRDPGVLRWRKYMTSFGIEGEDDDRQRTLETLFPYVRPFGRVALIGLNSAIPTPPGVASGRIDAEQLARLGERLRHLSAEGLCRVVMVHHPPLAGQASPRRALTNAAELEKCLCEEGAELVLHGHNHRHMLAWREGSQGAFPVVGVPSASVGRAGYHEERARYNIYRITPGDPRPHIEMTVRGLETDDGPVVELERHVLRPAEADAIPHTA